MKGVYLHEEELQPRMVYGCASCGEELGGLSIDLHYRLFCRRAPRKSLVAKVDRLEAELQELKSAQQGRAVDAPQAGA